MEHQCDASGGLVVKDGHIILLRDSGDLSKDDRRGMDILTGVYLALSNRAFQEAMIHQAKSYRSKMI